MSEMIERAKVAALVALAEHGKTTDLQEALVNGNNSVAPGAIDKMVRAVLKAIRKPAPDMLNMGWRHISEACQTGSDAAMIDMWQAMIDAALQEATHDVR